MIEIVVEIAKFLGKVISALGEYGNTDPAVQLAWRKTVAAILSAVLIVGVFSLCWMQGWVPGLSGVALASDVATLQGAMQQQMKANADASQATALIVVKSGIKQALKDRCRAIQARNQLAVDAANHDIEDFTDQYRSLTSREYHIADCSVILITPDP